MAAEKPHITVCVCTYQRPELLRRLLFELAKQKTQNLFTFSVVVADNDSTESARQVVSSFASNSMLPVTYCVEPQRNIALARNRTLDAAQGEFIAFIDDDEYPQADWLLHLFQTCRREGVDGVLGPVVPLFAASPPTWAVRGRFFERPRHKTGYRIGFSDMRTSNVLIRRSIVAEEETPFRAEFGTGGEDTDFFIRMSAKGCAFVWCDEAVVNETVPESRCTRSYLLRRSLRSGNNFFKIRAGRMRNLGKSFLALPLYSLALPFLFLAGGHHFMRYMVKLCDHAGRVLALIGIRPFSVYK